MEMIIYIIIGALVFTVGLYVYMFRHPVPPSEDISYKVCSRCTHIKDCSTLFWLNQIVEDNGVGIEVVHCERIHIR